MAKDLFTENLDYISFEDIEDFLAMKSPLEVRPTEGGLIDYKVDDSGDWVDVIAAFANTSGGLVFLGVQSDKNQNNAPAAIVGIAFSGGDIKARISSRILSQVTPRPDFQIAVVPLPSNPVKSVIAVRVCEGTYPPYQYSKERDKIRFPIRVQDSCRQANLRDLEHLFTKRGAYAETTEARIQSFLGLPLFPELLKGFNGPVEGEDRSPKPYHVWSVRPRVPMRIRLDRSFDSRAREIIKQFFPDTGFGQFGPPAVNGSSHIFRWQAGINSEASPPVRWSRYFEWTSLGDLRFSERIDRRAWIEGESVSDLYISGLRFLNLASEVYSHRNSFGGLSVLHTIRLQPDFKLLLTFPGRDGVYRETDSIRFCPAHAMNGTDVSNATMEIENSGRGDHIEPICEIMLTHLRQLRQAEIDYERVAKLVVDCPIDKPLIYFP